MNSVVILDLDYYHARSQLYAISVFPKCFGQEACPTREHDTDVTTMYSNSHVTSMFESHAAPTHINHTSALSQLGTAQEKTLMYVTLMVVH